MKRIVSAALSLLAFAPLAACGDDGGPSTTPAADTAQGGDSGGDTTGGTGFQSAFPASTQLSAMTDAERTALCAEVNAYGVANVPDAEMDRAGCTLSAIVAVAMNANEGQTCEQLVEACLAQPEEPGQDEGPCDGLIEATCTATVGEISSCLDARLVQIQPLLALTCESTMEQLQSLEQDVPEGCKAMQAKCPELFESEEGGDPQAGEGGGGTPTPR
jgi:hypothetical protein